MNKTIGLYKIVAAVIVFLLITAFAIYKLDTQDYSIQNNLWQYCAIVVSLVGCVGVYFFNKAPFGFRKRATFVVWLLAVFYFLFIVISSIVTRDFDWKFWLLATLLLLSTSLTFRDSRKNG